MKHPALVWLRNGKETTTTGKIKLLVPLCLLACLHSLCCSLLLANPRQLKMRPKIHISPTFSPHFLYHHVLSTIIPAQNHRAARCEFPFFANTLCQTILRSGAFSCLIPRPDRMHTPTDFASSHPATIPTSVETGGSECGCADVCF